MMIFQVDSFTDKPFSGNPAAVCIADPQAQPMQPLLMQKIAAEMNLSETAFLHQEGECWNIRWFTPVSEVDLCGHATLAAAHILWELKKEEHHHIIRFTSKSGLLTAAFFEGSIELDFPSTEITATDLDEEVFLALGVKPLFCGSDGKNIIVEIDTPEQVRAIKPDFERLKACSNQNFIITSKSDLHDYDFISRFFGPAIGINEDPVTGSAHCLLGPYWQKKLGKNPLKAWQASVRGGSVECEIKGLDRILIRGKAITVIKGSLNL